MRPEHSAVAEASYDKIALFLSADTVNAINPKIETWIDGFQ
jgi:hypothetical protein